MTSTVTDHAAPSAPDATVLELWQAEWCPSSHRVRQALTELNLNYLVHQVPANRDERAELERETGSRTIPVLVAGGDVIAGETAITGFLHERFVRPAGARAHREKAATARRKELEDACPQLAAPTH